MKSIEEKAKAYDKALERARAINNGKDVDVEEGTTICEYIFPELKENKDGKMWKLIKKYAHSNISDMALKADHITRKQLESWLEKQEFVNKEYTFKAIPRLLEMIQPTDRAKSYCQKLIDSLEQEGYSTDAKIVTDWLKTMNGEKVAMATMDEQKAVNEAESKFKVGDWIVNNISKDVFLIKSINSGYCTLEDINGNIISPCLPPIESESHLWTLQDAREGDVLSNDNHILILKELVYDWSSNGTPYSVKAYCGIKPDGNFEICKDNWCFCGTLHIHPATKEQCNTLKKAMADAGYIFDFDKKELKKIDQKSYGQRKECLYCQFNHAGECKGSCQMKINEQIHIDKIESKFKVGNWYQCTKDFFGKGVTFDKGTAYYCAKEGCLLDGCHIAIVKDLYDNFKQWTIDDAKKGDVLVDKYGNIGIYQGDKNAVTWDSYCYCGVNKGFYGKGSHEFPCYPASEEQRDLLFQKMKEAGYEWNAEKNVVKAHLRVKLGADLNAYKDSIIAELNYVMRDLKSYDELTDKEKEIWTREAFNELFDF